MSAAAARASAAAAEPLDPPLAPWLAAQRAALLAQRGHAWLLHGPAGLGQYELALALVRAWLCEAPLPDGQGACGQCASCHAIDVRTHADLCVLMPETEMITLGWPLSEKAQRALDDKTRKPSKEIRVDALREAIEFAQRTSGRGRGKAVLVYPAERKNAIAANALLKTLEEPPGDTRFVLATEAAHALLPTIRSRCLGHALHWPAESQALPWLAAQGVPSAEAPAWLRAAGGRPQAALALARSDRPANAWAAMPRALVRGDVAALDGLTPPQAIDALQKLCHDLLARHCGGAPRFFDAADLPPGPRGAAALPALSAWSRRLLAAARTAQHPFNAGLMTEFLVSEAAQVLNSTAAKP